MKIQNLVKLSTALLLFAFALAAFAGPSTALAKSQAPEPSLLDIVLAVNSESGEFSTLIAAVVAADDPDIWGWLSQRGQNTVFVPTDAAFAELDLNAGNVGDLGQEALRNILKYHFSPGKRFAEVVVSSDQIRMRNKSFASVTVNASGAFINQAQIIAVDIEASNGVAHVINGVLLP